MFICVSLTCGSCCACTGAVAFDPKRQRKAPSTQRGGCSTPTGGRRFGSLICNRHEERGDASDAAESSVLSGAISSIWHVFECVSGRLTREGGAQGKARRCNVPGYVCHRLAPGDGRWGRTVVQLHRNIEKTITRHVLKHLSQILVSLRPSVMCIHSK